MLETIMVRLPWLFIGWMACVGGAIGSFLNVVVYRMPAGMSISYPPSRCPKCESAIRAYHNIPVIGWLVLRGKCKNCSLPIAPRYPLVEAAVALLFGLLAVGSVARTHADGDVLVIMLQFIYYANGIACLLAFALIDHDANRIPRRLVLYSCLTVLLPPAISEDVQVHLSPSFIQELPDISEWSDDLLTVLCHAGLGGLTAMLASFVTRNSWNLVAASVLAGAAIGWSVPIVPIVVAACVTANLGQYVGKSSDNASQSAILSLLSSPVIALFTLTGIFILVHNYRGHILWY